ncbi:Guanine nucleotide exchange factor for Cdc42p [Balamuthia mandrillaris]
MFSKRKGTTAAVQEGEVKMPSPLNRRIQSLNRSVEKLPIGGIAYNNRASAAAPASLGDAIRNWENRWQKENEELQTKIRCVILPTTASSAANSAEPAHKREGEGGAPEEKKRPPRPPREHEKKAVASPPAQPSTSKMDLVCQELIETERRYLADLDIMTRHYMEPMRQRAKDFGLTTNDIHVVFSNLNLIYSLNKELLASMEQALLIPTNDKPGYIAGIFLAMADYLKMYTLYCSNHTEGNELIQRLSSKNEDYQEFEKSTLQDPEVKLQTLGSFLIKPTQRICRYPLFLSEMSKLVAKDSPAKADLEKALHKVQNVVTTINEAKRKAENLEIIKTIQERFPKSYELDLIHPQRRFESEATASCHYNEKYQPHVTIFLFNDSVLVATEKQKNMKMTVKKQAPPLRPIVLVSLDSVALPPSFVDETGLELRRRDLFMNMHRVELDDDYSLHAPLLLTFATAEERMSFATRLQELAQNYVELLVQRRQLQTNNNEAAGSTAPGETNAKTEHKGATAEVLWDVEAVYETELDLKAGDIVERVVQVNEEWMEGECRGRRGMFPANFVRVLQ